MLCPDGCARVVGLLRGCVVSDGHRLQTFPESGAYTADDLGQAAFEVALIAAMFLIRENGDPFAAIEGLAEASIPTEGDEVLDCAAIAAQAISRAVALGIEAR